MVGSGGLKSKSPDVVTELRARQATRKKHQQEEHGVSHHGGGGDGKEMLPYLDVKVVVFPAELASARDPWEEPRRDASPLTLRVLVPPLTRTLPLAGDRSKPMP